MNTISTVRLNAALETIESLKASVGITTFYTTFESVNEPGLDRRDAKVYAEVRGAGRLPDVHVEACWNPAKGAWSYEVGMSSGRAVDATAYAALLTTLNRLDTIGGMVAACVTAANA